jgi:hypothetical protein
VSRLAARESVAPGECEQECRENVKCIVSASEMPFRMTRVLHILAPGWNTPFAPRYGSNSQCPVGQPYEEEATWTKIAATVPSALTTAAIRIAAS